MRLPDLARARPLRSRLAYRVATIAVAALAAVLGSVRLGTKSLWLDETISAHHIDSGFRHLAHAVTVSDPNMGLYYVLLYVWTRIFGDGEVALRSLSVICATGAVVAVIVLGTRLVGRRAGLAAGLLLALDAYFVQYAQEARSYALLVLLVTLSSYFFVLEVEEPSLRSRAGWVVTGALAVYAHYFAAFVLAAQLLVLVARRAALSRRWLASVAALAVLCAPEAVFAHRKGTQGTLGWISRPTFHDLAAVPYHLAGASVAITAAFVVLGCLGLVLRRRREQRRSLELLAVWFLLPIVAAFAISFVQPMLEPRYLLVSLPPLALLAGNGVARLRPGVLAAVVLVVLVGLSARRLDAWYNRASFQDWRAVTRYVVARSRPGDDILFEPGYLRIPFGYYERRMHAGGLTEVTDGSAAGPAQRLWTVAWASEGVRATGSRRVAATRAFPRIVVQLRRP